MSYIGNPPAEAYTNTVKDTFSGDGTTTAFTLSLPTTTNNVRVVVENVIQDPTVAYGVSGTTLTFTSAPPSGTNNIYVVHLGPAVQTVQPPSDLSGNFTLTGDLTQTGDYTLTGTAEATNLTRGGSQVFSRDNILGTVSESSGAPTGAIIERGSNANGEFVKYADGTMICTGVVTFTGAFTSFGNVASAGTISVTFPVQFTNSRPSLSASLRESGGWANPFPTSNTLTEITSLRVSTTGAANRDCSWLAIGRWF